MQPVHTPQVALNYQVTGRRIWAALLDCMPMLALWAVLSLISGEYRSEPDNDVKRGVRFNLTNQWLVLYLGLVFLYYTLQEGLWGRTLGKRLLDLKVVGSDGQRCSWSAAIVRNLLRFVDWLPLLYFVGLIAVAVNKEKRRLGDLPHGTLVVDARKPAPQTGDAAPGESREPPAFEPPIEPKPS